MSTSNKSELISEDSVKKRLLHAAISLFTSKGYASTSVREIVEAAGVTKPVLYYYFKNKEDLYLEILQKSMTEIGKLMLYSESLQGDYSSRIKELANHTFSLFLEHLDVIRMIHSIFYGPPQGAPYVDLSEFPRKFPQIINNLVKDGVACSEFKAVNPMDVSLLIFAVITLTTDAELSCEELRIGRDHMNRLIDLIINGITVSKLGHLEDI